MIVRDTSNHSSCVKKLIAMVTDHVSWESANVIKGGGVVIAMLHQLVLRYNAA